MLRFYELSDAVAKFGFCTATIANVFFIYFTIFHIKRIDQTYKLMVLIFALLGIIFSAWELIARPFLHNFNHGFMFFSLNTWLIPLFPWISQTFLQLAMTVYAGFYAILLAFIAVQFVFRYYCLMHSEFSKKFDGIGMIVWIVYPLVCGVIYGGAFWLLSVQDEFSDKYFEEEILKVYELVIEEVPRMMVISYDPDGSFRWQNSSFLITAVLLLGLQYLIIVYCGIQMRLKIQKELQHFSVQNQKLQKQFFRALIVQTLAPTLLFILPVSGVLIVPMMDIEISVQSGVIYAIFSLYPPFDSLAFMLIVSEYRKVIKRLCKMLRGEKTGENNNNVSSLT